MTTETRLTELKSELQTARQLRDDAQLRGDYTAELAHEAHVQSLRGMLKNPTTEATPMTEKQRIATLKSLAGEWKHDKRVTLMDDMPIDELEQMYKGRCEAAGLDYNEFLELREAKSPHANWLANVRWHANTPTA